MDLLAVMRAGTFGSLRNQKYNKYGIKSSWPMPADGLTTLWLVDVLLKAIVPNKMMLSYLFFAI